jgi:hypothetical protein
MPSLPTRSGTAEQGRIVCAPGISLDRSCHVNLSESEIGRLGVSPRNTIPDQHAIVPEIGYKQPAGGIYERKN